MRKVRTQTIQSGLGRIMTLKCTRRKPLPASYLPPAAHQKPPAWHDYCTTPAVKKHRTSDNYRALLTSVNGCMRALRNNPANRKRKPGTMIADIQHEYTDLISANWRKLLGERAAKNILKIRRKNHERTYRKISRRSIRFLRRKLNNLEAQHNRTPLPS